MAGDATGRLAVSRIKAALMALALATSVAFTTVSSMAQESDRAERETRLIAPGARALQQQISQDIERKERVLQQIAQVNKDLRDLSLDGEDARYAEYCDIAYRLARTRIEVEGYYKTRMESLRETLRTCRANYDAARRVSRRL